MLKIITFALKVIY